MKLMLSRELWLLVNACGNRLAKQFRFEFSAEWNSDEYPTRTSQRMAILNSATAISLLRLKGNLIARLVDFLD